MLMYIYTTTFPLSHSFDVESVKMRQWEIFNEISAQISTKNGYANSKYENDQRECALWKEKKNKNHDTK